TTDVHIGADTELTFIAFLTKGWEEKQKIRFHVEGENTTINFIALIIAKDKEHFPFETESLHTVPHTNAYYYVRGAMFDKSEVDYTGYLNIRPGAQLTDSYLSHNSLMLSKEAKVRTVPSLEIEADDVKAGHAATIGKIDEDLLFYFESRGLNRQQAKESLITGFMETELKRIPSEEVQQALAREIEATLS
ncbi:SufD family Fe-S cluster assembly protein, partial [Candidatus Peregrinibacteria bacterium]|nr:SufD family Fe-S cluster assembly protein [Candidatus Peregrinibacteria bacterium]